MLLINLGLHGFGRASFVCRERQCVIADTAAGRFRPPPRAFSFQRFPCESVLHKKQISRWMTRISKLKSGQKSGLQEPPETPGAQPNRVKDENERVVALLSTINKLLSKCDTKAWVSGTEKFRLSSR
jgi:hypothetical protein